MGWLEIWGLSKVYNGNGRPVEALRRIDLCVQEGEFVAILGPSGCGKTTLLHIVAGLERSTGGQVLFRGQPVDGCSRERTLIFQGLSLFPWLTALDNVEFGLRLRGIAPEERRRKAGEMLSWMGLDAFADTFPGQLSGGMQQRVAIARALAVDPAILLMDEPFASVDAITRTQLQAELARLQRSSRKTVLLVTHSVREALVLADRVVVLSQRPAEVRLDTPVPRPLEGDRLLAWEQRILDELS